MSIPKSKAQSPIDEVRIQEVNTRYLGIDIDSLVDQAGALVSRELLKKYGKFPNFAFLCGLGQNGAEGMSAALSLAQAGIGGQITVYVCGRQKDFTLDAATHQWHKLQNLQLPNLTIKQDVFAKDVESHHVFVECLGGNTRDNAPYKRFRDIIKRCTHFRQKLVALDTPVSGYTWDLSVSLFYPKTADAIVLQLPLPPQVNTYTGPGEVQALTEPRRDSYKSQNGKLLIIGGSEEYHGAPVLAAKAASKYAGLVYFFSTSKHTELALQMESELAEFIEVTTAGLEEAVDHADAILVGIGWEDNILNKALLNYLLTNFPNSKYVLDGAAIGMADMTLVRKSGHVLFTPHRGELPRLLGGETRISAEALEGKLRRFCAEHNCYVNLKGSTSMLFGHNPYTARVDMRINRTGNQGMAKGGSGDVLAGITAAFTTKNDTWIAMNAGAFVCGVAGDLAAAQSGYMFTPTDTIACLPQAWLDCRNF